MVVVGVASLRAHNNFYASQHGQSYFGMAHDSKRENQWAIWPIDPWVGAIKTFVLLPLGVAVDAPASHRW